MHLPFFLLTDPRASVRATAGAKKSASTNVAEQLLQDGKFPAFGGRLARIHIDYLAIFQRILGKALHLINLVKANGKDVALGFFGIKKSLGFNPAGDIIITVSSKIDGRSC